MTVSDHNALYHRDLLNAIPAHATSALDIGCGDGALVRTLAAKVGHATGIDRHEPSILRARTASDPATTTFVLGDVAAHEFKPASFDVVTAVAMLHHGDAREGLARMIDLLAPGGMLGVIGLAARPTTVGDLAMDALAIARVRIDRLIEGGEPIRASDAPPVVWDVSTSYRDIRALANEMLPGHRYRRRMMFRYVLTWIKPS